MLQAPGSWAGVSSGAGCSSGGCVSGVAAAGNGETEARSCRNGERWGPAQAAWRAAAAAANGGLAWVQHLNAGMWLSIRPVERLVCTPAADTACVAEWSMAGRQMCRQLRHKVVPRPKQQTALGHCVQQQQLQRWPAAERTAAVAAAGHHLAAAICSYRASVLQCSLLSPKCKIRPACLHLCPFMPCPCRSSSWTCAPTRRRSRRLWPACMTSRPRRSTPSSGEAWGAGRAGQAGGRRRAAAGAAAAAGGSLGLVDELESPPVVQPHNWLLHSLCRL